MNVELGYTSCWCGTPFALPMQMLEAAYKNSCRSSKRLGIPRGKIISNAKGKPVTEFTIRLRTEATLTRAEGYNAYGMISEAMTACNDFDLQLVEITDDIAPVVGAPAVTRKPRGKNKPKVPEGKTMEEIKYEAEVQRQLGSQSSMPLPASLKRTAE